MLLCITKTGALTPFYAEAEKARIAVISEGQGWREFLSETSLIINDSPEVGLKLEHLKDIPVIGPQGSKIFDTVYHFGGVFYSLGIPLHGIPHPVPRTERLTVGRLFAHDQWVGDPFNEEGSFHRTIAKRFDELLEPLGKWLHGYNGPIAVDYTRRRFSNFVLAPTFDLGYSGFIRKAHRMGVSALEALRLELGI